MMVVEYLLYELLVDAVLDIVLHIAIEWVFHALSNLQARTNTNRIILEQYGFSIILCAVLHVLHHTPYVLIFLSVLSVLWRILAAGLNYMYIASEKLKYNFEPVLCNILASCSSCLKTTKNYMDITRKKLGRMLEAAFGCILAACCIKELKNKLEAIPSRILAACYSYTWVQKTVDYLSNACKELMNKFKPYMHENGDGQAVSQENGGGQAVSQENGGGQDVPQEHGGGQAVSQENGGRQDVPAQPHPSPSDQQQLDPLPPSPRPSQKSTSDYGSGQSTSSSSSTPALGHTPSIHDSPSRDNDVSSGYASKSTTTQSQIPNVTETRAISPTRPSTTLFSEGWDEPRKTVSQLIPGHRLFKPSSSYNRPPGHRPSTRYARTRGIDTSSAYVLKPTCAQSQLPRRTTTRATFPTRKEPTWFALRKPFTISLKKFDEPTKPKDISQTATNDTVSQLSPHHHPGTPSFRYTTPPGNTPIFYSPSRDSDTLLGYFLKGTCTQPQVHRITTTRATSLIKKEPTWSSSHTQSVLSHHKLDALIKPKATSHPATSTKSPSVPKVTTTKTTSPTKKKPTWSSWNTPFNQPSVTFEEPKSQASHHDGLV